MTVYEIPATSPYQRAFRILGWGAVGVLLGILVFSFYEPARINDSTSHAIGWLAGAILLAAIVGTATLGVKEGSWKLMRMSRFEVTDGKIIEMREGATSRITEIPLNEIDSLGDHCRWLFVIGGTPRKQIAIPKEVRDFETPGVRFVLSGTAIRSLQSFDNRRGHPSDHIQKWTQIPVVLPTKTSPQLAAPIFCDILSPLVNGPMYRVDVVANLMVQNLSGHHVT